MHLMSCRGNQIYASPLQITMPGAAPQRMAVMVVPSPNPVIAAAAARERKEKKKEKMAAKKAPHRRAVAKRQQ